MAVDLNPPRGARRGALAALVVLVVAVHAWVTGEVAGSLRDASDAAAMPTRIEVAYVREMQPSLPPVAVAAAPAAPAAPAASARRAVKKPQPVAKAASTPEVAASQAALQVADAAALPADAPQVDAPQADAPAADVLIAEVPPAALVAEAAQPVAASAVAASVDATTAALPARAADGAQWPAEAASGAGDAAPFDWPVSTRLSYRLTGYYRGEVEGEAQVEWVRSGDRYQVHLDVLAGLPVAPLFTRRMSSDGEITAAGLVPRRYDQDTKVAFRDRKRDTLLYPHMETVRVLVSSGAIAHAANGAL